MSATRTWRGAAHAPRTRANRAAAVVRLGRRTVRAGGWRNGLIVALIALGIAVAVVVAVGARSTRVPDDAYLTERFGRVAEVRIDAHRPAPAWEDLSAEQQAAYIDATGAAPDVAPPLPPVEEVVSRVDPGAEVLGFVERYVGRHRVLALDIASALADGLVADAAIVPGRGEALLSPAALELEEIGVGGELTLPAAGTAIVVGTVSHPFRADEVLVVLPEGALGPPTSWLVDATDAARAVEVTEAVRRPVGPEEPVTAERYGETREQVRASTERTLPDRIVSDPSFVGAAVGALLLTMVGLIAAAAFATGLRRRIREVGVLGATGASPAQLRHLALAEAAVLGTAGAALGVALGLAASAVGTSLIERVTGTLVTGLDVAPGDLLAPAAVGVVAAVAAALWPSITAARTSTTTALAGRVPLRAVPPWLPVLSIVVTVTALVVAAVSIRARGGGLLATGALAVSVVAVALGAASLGVPLLGAGGRLAARLPVGPRIVVRDAVRQRTRSGATVAALVVVLMLPTLALTTIATDEVRVAGPLLHGPSVSISGPWFGDVQLPPAGGALQEVLDVLPVTPTARLDVTGLGAPPGGPGLSVQAIPDTPVGGPSRHAPGTSPPVLATEEVLAAVGVGGEVAAAVLDGEVVLDVAVRGTLSEAQRAAGPRDGVLSVEALDAGEDGRAADGRQRVDILSVESDVQALAPSLLLAPTLASAVGLAEVGRTTVLQLPRPLTDREVQPIWDGSLLAPDEGYVDASGIQAVDPWPGPRWIAIGLALAVVLVITATATALAATESDRDIQAMVAVGADPSFRRRFHGLQAAYHAGLAALIALPAGLLLHLVLDRGVHHGSARPTTVVPWAELLVLGVGVPAVVGLLMWAGMRPARPLPERRTA